MLLAHSQASKKRTTVSMKNKTSKAARNGFLSTTANPKQSRGATTEEMRITFLLANVAK